MPTNTQSCCQFHRSNCLVNEVYGVKFDSPPIPTTCLAGFARPTHAEHCCLQALQMFKAISSHLFY